jgi:predicted glycosyltransferase
LQNAITYPFATELITPDCYQGDLGSKHTCYAGYQELAYLHPRYFQPDSSIRDDLGLQDNESYSLLRFVSWDASHDRGNAGMPLSFKRQLVDLLSKYGRVIISSEAPLPNEFEPYRVAIPPYRMHDLLAFAQLYVGEGATMASEAALVGTPAVYTNALSLGYLDELEAKYGLVFNLTDPALAISKAGELLQQQELRQEFAAKRERLLTEKVDVTAYVCDLVAKYWATSTRESKASSMTIQ